MNRWQVPALLLILLGAAVAGYGVQTSHFGTTEYRLYVTSADAPGSDVPGDAVITYENLSASGQRLFDRALGGEDNAAVVYGEENAPPDFDYASDAYSLGHGWYYVEKGGEYYEVLASYDSGGAFEAFYLGFHVLAGLVLAGLGAGAHARDDARISTAALAAIVVIAVLASRGIFHWFDSVHVTAIAVLVPAAVAAAVTWIAVERVRE